MIIKTFWTLYTLFSLLAICQLFSACGQKVLSPPKSDIVAKKIWINGVDSFFALLPDGTIKGFYCGKYGTIKFVRDNVEDIIIKFEPAIYDVPFESPKEATSYHIVILLKSFDEISPGKTPSSGKFSTPGNLLEEIK